MAVMDAKLLDQAQAAAAEAEAKDRPPAPAAEAAAPAPDTEAAASAPAPALDYQAEALAVVDFCAKLGAEFFPTLAKVYTPETVAKLAAAAAPLLQKYGVTMGGLFATWGAEINFAMVALPVVIQTRDAIRHDLATRGQAGAGAAAPDAAAIAARGAELSPQVALFSDQPVP